jgi:hypothetical protein
MGSPIFTMTGGGVEMRVYPYVGEDGVWKTFLSSKDGIICLGNTETYDDTMEMMNCVATVFAVFGYHIESEI